MARDDRTQNQLPSWIAQSTVNGDSTTSQLETLAAAELAARASREIKPSQNAIAATDSSTADFDSYYATLEAAGEEPTEEDEVIIETPILSSLRASATPGSSSATVTPKLEVLSDDDFDVVAVKLEADLVDSVENGKGKRSRDEADDEWDDESNALEEMAKKARVEGDAPPSEPNEEEDEDDFEFDEGEADQDTNPMISVAGKLLPFEEVKGSEELTAAMVSPSLSSCGFDLIVVSAQTPDEYIVRTLIVWRARRSWLCRCFGTSFNALDKSIFVYFVLALSFTSFKYFCSSSSGIASRRET